MMDRNVLNNKNPNLKKSENHSDEQSEVLSN